MARKQRQPGAAAVAGGATCSVSPDPAQRFSDVVISGSGWMPYSTVGILVISDIGDIAILDEDVDANGDFVYPAYHTVWLGVNTVIVNGAVLATFTVN